LRFNNCPIALWRHHQNIHQSSIVQRKGSWSFGVDRTTQIHWKSLQKLHKFTKRSGIISKCSEYYKVHMNTHYIRKEDYFSLNCFAMSKFCQVFCWIWRFYPLHKQTMTSLSDRTITFCWDVFYDDGWSCFDSVNTSLRRMMFKNDFYASRKLNRDGYFIDLTIKADLHGTISRWLLQSHLHSSTSRILHEKIASNLHNFS